MFDPYSDPKVYSFDELKGLAASVFYFTSDIENVKLNDFLLYEDIVTMGSIINILEKIEKNKIVGYLDIERDFINNISNKFQEQQKSINDYLSMFGATNLNQSDKIGSNSLMSKLETTGKDLEKQSRDEVSFYVKLLIKNNIIQLTNNETFLLNQAFTLSRQGKELITFIKLISSLKVATEETYLKDAH